MAGKQFKLDILISAIDKVTAPLTRINNRVKAITAPGRQLANSFASLSQESGLSTVADRARRVVTALGDVGTAAMTAGRRIAGIAVAGGGLAYLFKREFIDTASTFENLQISLEAIEGSREKAADSMAFIKKMTVETPLQLQDITRAFRLMRGQGMDPMKGQLQALIDYASKLGGSGDMVMSIATQLSQAWSKQKLQQQDVRVMAEEGVGVWTLLARAVERVSHGTKKITPKELIAMSEKGQLGPKAILLLMEQMEFESKGQATRMMGTWTGLVSNLADQWTFFKLRVMQSGPFDRVKAVLANILARINQTAQNGQLQAWADRFAAKLETVFLWLEQNGPRILGDIEQNLEMIFSFADRVATAFGGWGNLVTFGIAAYIAGPLVASVFSLMAAIASLNLALAGTPAGWLLFGGAAAIAGVALAWTSLKFPGAPQTQRFDGAGRPLLDARAAAAVTAGGAAAAPVTAAPAAPGLIDMMRAIGSSADVLNPFKVRNPDTAPGLFARSTPAASAIRVTGPAAPPVSVSVPSARPSALSLSSEDQQAIAAAFTAASAQQSSGAAPQASIKVDIQHSNVPRGTKLRVTQSGNVPIDLSRGVSMAHAF